MDSRKIEKYIRKGFPEQWYDYANELKSASIELWKSNSNTLVGYFGWKMGMMFSVIKKKL